MIQFDSRKYVGSRFGFSISVPLEDDPDWPASYGDPEPVVNEFVFTEGSSILFEGGHLVLGHRWADAQGQWNQEGVLDHLMMKSRDFRSFRPASPDPQTGAVSPAILNLLAWPDPPPPPSEEHPHRLIKEGVLEIRQVRPSGFDDSFFDKANDPAGAKALLATPQGLYARLRALTAMRRELVRATDFRLCIGGALGKPERRLPGVVEEALLTAQVDKPLYLSSAFGGVSKALADCLLQRRIKMDLESVFFTPDPVAKRMKAQSAAFPLADEFEGPSSRAGWNALAFFESLSLDKLGAQAGLTSEQYIDLLATPNIERAMAWVMSGVSNLIREAKGNS
jgi:hypothetical protein